MAPDNFLADLHTRMEQTSPLKKLFQKLFVPFRIKIPLELATATVVAVFAFYVVQSPDIKKEWELSEYQAEPSIAEEAAPAESSIAEEAAPAEPMAEEIPRPAQPAPEPKVIPVQPAPEPKVIPVQPARKPVASRAKKMPSTAPVPSKAKEAQRRAAKKERSSDAEPAMSRANQLSATVKKSPPLELVLFIPAQKPKSGPYSVKNRLTSPLVKQDRMAAPAPEAETLRRRKGEGATGGVVGGSASQPMDESQESDFSPAHVISRVEKIVRRLQGKMVSVQYEKQTQQPQFIVAEIPARHYQTLIKDLGTIGSLRSPQPDITAKKAETVRIRIRLMPF